MKKFKKDVHITANPPKDVSGLPQRGTNRLRIDSWERSNRANGRAGDAIALHWMRPEAKAFIGWWDSTDPKNPICKAWIGAHDKANNPNSAPHRHLSAEVTDAEGHIQTPIAIPYDRDHTNITTSRADCTVAGGTFRIPQCSNLEFAVNNDASKGSRWKVQMTSSQDLELSFIPDGDSASKSIAKMNSDTGRLEIEALEAADVVMRDRGSGAPMRLYVENGKICVEELGD